MFVKTPKQISATNLQAGTSRHCMLFGGSRSGKTFQNVRSVIIRALRFPRSRHLIVRNTLKSVKTAIILDTIPKLLELCFPDLIRSFTSMNKTSLYWTLPNKSQIFFGGIGNVIDAEKILGTEYATIFFNEASELSYRSVLKVRTRLAQNIPGMNLKFYYDCNPPSKTHWTHREFIEHVNPLNTDEKLNGDDFTSLLMNPSDNITNLPPGYIQMLESLPELERNRFLFGLFSDDVYGAIFGSDIAKMTDHIGSYPHNPNYPVYTGWDIGHSDDTAIWFYQVINGKLYFIDCYHNNFEGLPHYIQVLNDKPYKYAIDFYPHDGANTEWAWGKTRRAIAIEEFKRNVLVLPKLLESDQVSLVRSMLNICYFDQKKCAYGLDALRSCRYEFNDKLGNFKNSCMVHDEYSHYAKAFIYSCMGYDKKKKEVKYVTAKEDKNFKLSKTQEIINNFIIEQSIIDKGEI